MKAKSSAVVTMALLDCTIAVRTSIHHQQIEQGHLGLFVNYFSGDFHDVLDPDPSEKPEDQKRGVERWLHDRERVTTLARAIGTLAEFLSLAEKAPTVTEHHLGTAYKQLKGYCVGEDSKKPDPKRYPQREYCAKAGKVVGVEPD